MPEVDGKHPHNAAAENPEDYADETLGLVLFLRGMGVIDHAEREF